MLHFPLLFCDCTCRGFKALKKIVKLNFKIGKFENMLNKYKLFLTYIKSAVTSNYSEKGINSILDLASTSTDLDLIQQMYDVTLKSLLDAKNEVFVMCFRPSSNQLFSVYGSEPT